jgi:hypothetical protein
MASIKDHKEVEYVPKEEKDGQQPTHNLEDYILNLKQKLNECLVYPDTLFGTTYDTCVNMNNIPFCHPQREFTHDTYTYIQVLDIYDKPYDMWYYTMDLPMGSGRINVDKNPNDHTISRCADVYRNLRVMNKANDDTLIFATNEAEFNVLNLKLIELPIWAVPYSYMTFKFDKSKEKPIIICDHVYLSMNVREKGYTKELDVKGLDTRLFTSGGSLTFMR